MKRLVGGAGYWSKGVGLYLRMGKGMSIPGVVALLAFSALALKDLLIFDLFGPVFGIL